MVELLRQRLPPHLQVADFLGQLLDEVVGPDVVRDLAGGLAHLQRRTRTSVQAGGVKRDGERRRVSYCSSTLTSRFNQVRSALIKAFTPSTR